MMVNIPLVDLIWIVFWCGGALWSMWLLTRLLAAVWFVLMFTGKPLPLNSEDRKSFFYIMVLPLLILWFILAITYPFGDLY